MILNTLLFEKVKEIAYITLNRPKKLNAISREMLSELNELIGIVEKDDDIKVLIITGNRKVFAAGADIDELNSYQSTAELLNTTDLGHEVLLRLEQLSKPSIAVVNGIAYGGGCEISLACDFRIAADDGKFAIPEIKLGLIPGWGGASRLQKLVPFPKFKEMLLTGEPLTAVDAASFGLVNKVVSSDLVMETAVEFASNLTNKAPAVIGAAKRLANIQLNTNLQTAIELEKQTIAVLYGAEDRIEGTKAFVEKRQPIWSSR
ncbi:enoyl-CoA hydratase/isomerase family protein [Psychrobacillus sp. NPDC096426]|uniref:enoyl-CoA hydratase/isomerase family protein n=1 Tax=Psychrobacillus sp. NPDC096426 TaxID=3364491 RepID=UPI003815C22B